MNPVSAFLLLNFLPANDWMAVKTAKNIAKDDSEMLVVHQRCFCSLVGDIRDDVAVYGTATDWGELEAPDSAGC